MCDLITTGGFIIGSGISFIALAKYLTSFQIELKVNARALVLTLSRYDEDNGSMSASHGQKFSSVIKQSKSQAALNPSHKAPQPKRGSQGHRAKNVNPLQKIVFVVSSAALSGLSL